MLGNLDNQVILKKAFTDKTVFKAFVRDILGIEIDVETIETEKKFSPKIGSIDFEIDIYAESVDKRVAVEIQRVQYDHNFDRFMHYFFMLIAEQQRTSESYIPKRTVYTIIVLTAPYRIDDKNGNPILDEVLLLKLNPRTLGGKECLLNDHRLIFLNPNYKDPETPQVMRDWLELIFQSIHQKDSPNLNTENEGIKKAMELIDVDTLTPEQRAQKIDDNDSKIVLALERRDTAIEIARNLIAKGFDNIFISEVTGLTVERVERIRNTDYSRLRKP